MKVANLSLLVGMLAVLLGGSAATAQPFDSGSNGSDGALDLTGLTGTLVFDPAGFDPPLDPDHDNVYHFTTIKVPGTLTVRLAAEILGVKPVVWLSTGAVVIDGILDLAGGDGNGPAGPQIVPSAGAGGYTGGLGASAITGPQPGKGPGGGQAAADGAGHAVAGTGLSGAGGAAYGNPFLIPQLGGSGGAGGTFFSGTGNRLGSEGGSGGGALLIASSHSITFAPGSRIDADGGDGACNSGVPPGAQSSGGGSGGSIRLMAPKILGTCRLTAAGGTSCNSGGRGSVGRIRLEAFQLSVTGPIDPSPVSSPPGLVFPPASAPSVRIVSIGGVAVPASPTASFVEPDVTLDNATTVTIQLAASKVPVGTVVRLTLTPETGAVQSVDSTPLAGTFDASTATASVTIPHGFSRFSVQATWTP